MAEGITCYERDEVFCEDQWCLRVGCILRNKRLVRAQLAEARKALEDVAARARFELDHPTPLRDTAFSLIEKAARAALQSKDHDQINTGGSADY